MADYQLKTNRGLWKTFLLSLLTLGIYGQVVMTGIGRSLNTVASRYDSKKTMNYCLVSYVFGPLTLGIALLGWYHRLSFRVGDELLRRGLPYRISTNDFWGWNVLGALILVGPFIYLHKLCKAMNYLCDDYNVRG